MTQSPESRPAHIQVFSIHNFAMRVIVGSLVHRAERLGGFRLVVGPQVGDAQQQARLVGILHAALADAPL